MLRRRSLALCLAASFPVLAAFGQGAGKVDPGALPLEYGRRALEAGRATEALEHASVALGHELADPRAHDLALRATAGSPDAQAAAAWDAARALCDAAGAIPWPAAGREFDAGLRRRLEGLASARVAAVRELTELAQRREQRAARQPEERLVALWARRTARAVLEGTPALEREFGPRLAPLLPVDPDDARLVVRALDRVAKRALSGNQPGDALRVARVLHGLGVQAKFKDLEGPPPRGVDGLAAQAATLLARARERVAAAAKPWTVDELAMLLREEGESFTRQHDSFARPGVALSPRGWYRVETDCGHQTLLGVAETIEDHHERLAAWYGRDPFAGKPGLVRVVPEASGLEAEGTPFWWAGGFQSGDTTTVRFSCGTIEGLGRLLTHELTHRFDGALFPGQPAWLTEGKAVWTGASYGHSTDREFVPLYAQFGTLQGAWIKGYGNLDKLTELLEGRIEEYRDNYVAGYALYLYLATEEREGRRPFAPNLVRYMQGCRTRGADPKAWFVEVFCDGKDGRPASLEDFASAFGTFLSGFYWLDPKPWSARYTQELPRQRGDAYVYDEPTWVWSRQRAEPWFGEGQARLAGELLAELGEREEALRAHLWGLAVDGRSPRVEGPLVALLEGLGKKEAAWALRRELAPQASETAPVALARSWPRTQAYLDLLAGAAREAGGWAGALLAAERDALAARLGLPPIAADPPAPEPELLRVDPPARPLGGLGYEEDGLTGYEERRVSGLWFVDEHGRLHVGRSRPREATGSLDPRAHQRDAFVRTNAWIDAGAYRLRCRVRFTTSFASGALVLGHARRDRNVRLAFSAGDFLYSIGEKQEAAALESVAWNLGGLYEREGALPGARPGGQHEFPAPTPAFRLELVVDGGSVHVAIDGRRVGTYHTADGAPIEGHVGFASSFGAFEISELTLQRLERSLALDRAAARGVVRLDLERDAAAAFQALSNHTVRGLTSASTGTLLLWLGAPHTDEGERPDPDALLARAESHARRLVDLLRRDGATQPLVIVAPPALPPAGAAALRRELAAALGRALQWIERPAPKGETEGATRSWLAFVDPAGALRSVETFFGVETELPPTLRHWLDTHRDHGRPARELPPLPRGGDVPSEGGPGSR